MSRGELYPDLTSTIVTVTRTNLRPEDTPAVVLSVADEFVPLRGVEAVELARLLLAGAAEVLAIAAPGGDS